MVYSVTGTDFYKKAIINGANGVYGQPTSSATGVFNEAESIRYGRNAINNFNEYNRKELGGKVDVNNPPAMDYEVKYLPEEKANRDNLNTMALIGAAYEDMGGRDSVPVQELNSMYSKVLGNKACVDAYDINKDDKIDIAENAVATLIKDMTSGQDSNNPSLDSRNIDGKFTRTGDINSNFMLAINNVDHNRNLAKLIYDHFKLGDAQNKFLSLTKH